MLVNCNFNDFVAKIQIHNNHYINNRLNPNNFEAKIKLISPVILRL